MSYKKIIPIIICLLFIPINIKAESLINQNGIEISEEELENFLKVYSYEHIMVMDEEKYEKAQSLNYDNVLKTDKYIETIYNPHLNITTERELTESEYENYVPLIEMDNLGNVANPNLNSGSMSMETTAKKMSMTFAAGSYWNTATLTATWKYLPTTRSFDVIGFYGVDFNFRNGSQEGEQIYIDTNDNYNVINYSWNGTNIKKFNNGFGISMNLVNPTIQFLQLYIECDMSALDTHPELFGSYQHAVANLTLTQSQNYTLGGSGLGGVFIYPYNISSKLDGMSGLPMYF